MLKPSDLADIAADLTVDFIAKLHRDTGVPVELILIGAHAAIVTAMVEHLGGPMVAASCERAAKRVRSMPSRAASALAYAAPAGTA